MHGISRKARLTVGLGIWLGILGDLPIPPPFTQPWYLRKALRTWLDVGAARVDLFLKSDKSFQIGHVSTLPFICGVILPRRNVEAKVIEGVLELLVI